MKSAGVESQHNGEMVSGSRPLQALSLLMFTRQRRNWLNNLCCVALCPLLMVAIAALLGNLISGLIQKANPVNEFIYCSNAPAMNTLNIPFWSTNDARLPLTNGSLFKQATQKLLKNTNFAIVRSIKTTGPPGASAFQFIRPCSYWYGDEYPTSSLYDRSPNTTGVAVRDSSFIAQPLRGWINSLAAPKFNYSNEGDILNAAITLSIINANQMRSWSLFASNHTINASLIGSKNYQQPVQNLVSLGQQKAFNNASGLGLLDTFPNRYFAEYVPAQEGLTVLQSLTQVPWYNSTTGTANDLDDQITSLLSGALVKISSLDKAAFLTPANILNAQINQLLKVVPHGSIYFEKINHATKEYKWTLQYGTDRRLEGATNFPLPGPRMMLQQTQLSNAVLRTSNASFSSAQITQGFRIMPQIASNAISIPFGGIIGSILYPFGVSFLLPIFAITLVQEKETRIMVMMRMNGLGMLVYYSSHYITFYILYTLSTAVFLISGIVSKLSFFTLTERPILLILFFIWGHNQITLAFLFSTFFNKSSVALGTILFIPVSVFLVVLASVVVSIATTTIFVASTAPIAFLLWPPFAFYRALQVVNVASYDTSKIPYRMGNLTGDDEILRCILFMVGGVIVIALLTFYFSLVFPTEFGVSLPWHFPFSKPFNAFFKKDEKMQSEQENIEDGNTIGEDDDVRQERVFVTGPKIEPSLYPLLMKNMRKVFTGRGGAGPKISVKNVTLAVERNTIFGLLGPNGAGKTTLISILTGLYKSSNGVATIAGYDIKKDAKNVYGCIGICPQFDILWDDLTVGEHLYFYARLKGVPRKVLRESVTEALTNVSLNAFETRLSKGLSGGEKRRLSIAIALLGAPSVIFLDEPTTGLDPEVRRLIWDIINNASKFTTVVLTTHSMEEAEALCSRIGIMAKGTLRCLGQPLRLKQLYGPGFKLFANSLAKDTSRVCEYIESILPAGWKKLDAFATSTTYEFPPVPGFLQKLFVDVEARKTEVGILDWGVGQTTLEEVFVKIISDVDAQADY